MGRGTIGTSLTMKNLKTSLRLFENTGDGVWAVDANQRIIYWNQAAEKLLGYTVDEAVGRNCYELLAGRGLGDEPVCRFKCRFCEEARKGQVIDSFNLRVTNKERQSSWISISGIFVPVSADSRDFSALIHLFRLINNDNASVPPLIVRLLGPVMVQRADGTPVDGAFQQRAKVRALFSVLVIRRSRGVQRDELLSKLWPEMPRHAGLHNLNTTVYHLRHSLEPGLKHGPDSTYIKNRGERYLLVGSQSHWLDVDVFETKIAASRRVADTGKQERLYREAIKLYRGEFLAGLDADMLDCWIDRERYHQRYLEALQGLGGILSTQQKSGEASDMYLEILAADPYNESAVRDLMRLALNNDDRTYALSLYDDLRVRLRDEMELKPSKETQLLAKKARMTE